MNLFLMLLIIFGIPAVGIACIAWSICCLARKRFIPAAILGLIGIVIAGAVMALCLAFVGFVEMSLLLTRLIMFGILAVGIACIAWRICRLVKKSFLSAAIAGLIGIAIAAPVITVCPGAEVLWLAKIEQESGIDLPDGAKGLRYHFKPPIDPIVFAKIEIPADAQDMIAKQIEALTFHAKPDPSGFANESCEWWPPAPENVVLSKHAHTGRFYVDLYLAKEKDAIILYIKYFTI